MKKKSRHANIQLFCVCCIYAAAVSVCICMMSHPLAQESDDFPESLTITPRVENKEAEILHALEAEMDTEIQEASQEAGELQIIVKMEEAFEYDPEFLATVRGKDAEKLLHPVIDRVATEYEIDPALIKSIIWAESSFNPKAVSKKGAMGLMQLMPETARALGIEDSLNPESNIDGGVRYFKKLLVKFKGDAKLALAAYNAGSRRVLQYNGVPPFEATQYYIEKVFEYYEGYKQYDAEAVDQI